MRDMAIWMIFSLENVTVRMGMEMESFHLGGEYRRRGIFDLRWWSELYEHSLKLKQSNGSLCMYSIICP